MDIFSIYKHKRMGRKMTTKKHENKTSQNCNKDQKGDDTNYVKVHIKEETGPSNVVDGRLVDVEENKELKKEGAAIENDNKVINEKNEVQEQIKGKDLKHKMDVSNEILKENKGDQEKKSEEGMHTNEDVNQGKNVKSKKESRQNEMIKSKCSSDENSDDKKGDRKNRSNSKKEPRRIESIKMKKRLMKKSLRNEENKSNEETTTGVDKACQEMDGNLATENDIAQNNSVVLKRKIKDEEPIRGRIPRVDPKMAKYMGRIFIEKDKKAGIPEPVVIKYDDNVNGSKIKFTEYVHGRRARKSEPDFAEKQAAEGFLKLVKDLKQYNSNK